MKQSLDSWDIIPEDMKAYYRNYGKHFNKKMYEFAVGNMYKINKQTGKKEFMPPMTKEQVDTVLKRYNIKLENDVMYDAAYVMMMAKADFFGSSLIDERVLAQFVKDYVDDPDQVDGFIFNRFYADCVLAGEPIEWSDMI